MGNSNNNIKDNIMDNFKDNIKDNFRTNLNDNFKDNLKDIIKGACQKHPEGGGPHFLRGVQTILTLFSLVVTGGKQSQLLV